MLNFLCVFLGGGLGSLCRYGMSYALPKSMSDYPFATFGANILSCVLLGYLMGLTSNNSMSQSTKLLLMTGFCGGFSTFSTFAGENMQLIDNQQYGLALFYTSASFIIGLCAIFMGLRMAS